MPLFTQNQTVKFERNATVKADSTTIVAVVNNANLPFGITTGIGQMYIIEHTSGWAPDAARKAKFGLNQTKKYLFVKESELTAL